MNLLKNIFYIALLFFLAIFYIPLMLINRLIIFCCDWILILSSKLIELLIDTIKINNWESVIKKAKAENNGKLPFYLVSVNSILEKRREKT